MDRFIIQKTDFNQEDISQIVAIHRKEIGQGFLSSLGDKALQLIFSLAAESKSGVLLAAKDAEQGQACGFVLGTVDTRAFYRDFLFTKSLSAVISLAPKLFSFEKLRKVFETLLYPSKSEIQEMPKAELMDIAVLRNYQGTGLAQLLFYKFSEVLRESGVETFRITTGESLVRAQRFYERLGAKEVASIQIHQGQETLVYIYETAQTQ